MIRILLPPHPEHLERSLSTAKIKVVGQIADPQVYLEQISLHSPDIAIVDLTWADSLWMTRQIREHSTATQVLVIGHPQNLPAIEDALQSGARGYIPYGVPAEDFVHAIHTIHRGYLHLSPEILGQISPKEVDAEVIPVEAMPEPLADLNPADEWSVLTKDLLNTSPRAWTRGLLYLLVIFAAVLIPWATLAQVDETGSARGRLEPSGQAWRLDAPVGGSVTSIHVKEGETVQAGQVLMDLDAELVNRELQQTQTQLAGLQSQLNQLELLKHQLVLTLNTQRQQNQAQQLEKQVQVQQAQQQLDNSRRISELQSVERLSPIDQAQANVQARQSALGLARSRHTQDQGEVERFRKLADQGVVPLVQLIEKQKIAAESHRLLSEAEADLQQANLALAEAQRRYQTLTQQGSADVAQAQLRLTEQKEGYQSLVHAGELVILKNTEELNSLEGQITSLRSQITQTQSQIKALEHQRAQHQVKAPIAGTIFEMPISRAGAVIQPGTLVAEIGPQGAPMILKAQMATAESGSLKTGLPVKLKFDAYPFQDYGVLEGEIRQISPTSKVNETVQGNLATFDLEIELRQTCIPTPTSCVPLTPGQTATAEVIVRQRRVLDFIIDPFKRLQKGGLPL